MTREQIETLITDNITTNSNGEITAVKVKTILDAIVNDYRHSTDEITLSQVTDLVSSLAGKQATLTATNIKTIVDLLVEMTTPIDADKIIVTDSAGTTSKKLSFTNIKAFLKTYFDTLYQSVIAAGTTAQYWRGDKTWQTLDKTAVGLSNVANIDTTNASNISSGTLETARLGSGTANSTTYLRGDQTWQSLSFSVPQVNKIYVDSINGVDSTGRGRIDNPYLTVEYALSDNNNTGTITATTTTSSNVLTSVSSTSNIVIGQVITGTGIPYDSIVISKTSNTITLSRTCTASATITATWWTIYELQLNGNFTATSNWFKAGFWIDANLSNISFGAFTLFNKTSSVLIHESIKGGNWFGTNSASKFQFTSTGSSNDILIDLNYYYSIGTGNQIDLQQYGAGFRNLYFKVKNFDARFGKIGYFYGSGRINIEGDFYGLLYGMYVRTTTDFVFNGTIETPSSIVALEIYGPKINANANILGQISTSATQGFFNGNINGTTHSIGTSQYSDPFIFSGTIRCTTLNQTGAGNSIYKGTIDCATFNISDGNTDISVFRGNYVGSGASKGVVSSMQIPGNVFPFRNITLTNTAEIIVINNPLQDGAVVYGNYPNISIASGCKMTVLGFSYGAFTLLDGTFINRGTFNLITRGAGSGLMVALSGLLENNGTIELVRYGVEGSLNTPCLIVGTGKFIQNGGKLFCTHSDSKSGLIRKTASGGKILLKGQPQLIVANGLAPLQILSNTGTSQDVHNFGIVGNGAIGFRLADTFSDTTYGTAYAPNLIGTATNNEDTNYNI